MSKHSAVVIGAGPNGLAALTGSPLQIGASIRMNDSLQDHCSRFHAEIRHIGADQMNAAEMRFDYKRMPSAGLTLMRAVELEV